MSKLDKSLTILDSLGEGGAEGYMHIDPRSQLLVTVVYLCLMLSVPSTHIDLLIWYSLYPILAAPLFGVKYSKIFLQSLIILPLLLLIGVFNPIVDKTPVAMVGDFTITTGWLMFAGVLLRGLLSLQSLLIIIHSIGFVGIVRALDRLGLPKFLTTQLLMVFRYIRVLIEEGLAMKAARDARSFGRKHLSVKMWGVLVGQLFLRSVDRAERVHRAMQARGFSGEMMFYTPDPPVWRSNSTTYLVIWTLVFVFLRLFNLSLLFV